MTTFRFNFQSKEDDTSEEANESEVIPVGDSNVNVAPTEEILPRDVLDKLEEFIFGRMTFLCDDLELSYVHQDDAVKYLEEAGEAYDATDVSKANRSHSDLIEGKYEGGLKIWECTYDLAKHILSNEDISFKDANVLDLGCGGGILGITALLKGANVHFQDYNREVIIGATIPNVSLNLEDDNRNDIVNKCKFFTGDWSSFEKFLDTNMPDHHYDYILTSETIYNVKNYPKLCSLLRNKLKKSGSALAAAKSCYFGVGGNMQQFKSVIDRDALLKYTHCWKNEDGVGREIIKIFIDER